MITEADTCRKYIIPKLNAAGWTDDQITEQKYFTDGRIGIENLNTYITATISFVNSMRHL